MGIGCCSVAIERWEARTAIGEVFRFGFPIRDSLGEWDPAFEVDGAFVRFFGDVLVGFEVVFLVVGRVVVGVFPRDIGRVRSRCGGEVEIFLEVWNF